MYLKYYSIIILSVFLFSKTYIIEASDLKLKKGEVIMCLKEKAVQNIDRYKNNLSSMSSFIILKLKDIKTGKLLNVVIENILFADYLAMEQGMLRDKMGRFKDSKVYIKFKENNYVEFMLKNDLKPIEISFESFEKFVGKEYLNTLSFDNAMSFQHLNVVNEKGLIEEYFDFNCSEGSGTLKKKYYEKYANNVAFIAFLIELGYDVLEGDISPDLIIYTNPFIQLMK